MNEKREKENCYRCRFFNYRELKKSTRYYCLMSATAQVGANWCKYYKPLKETEQ